MTNDNDDSTPKRFSKRSIGCLCLLIALFAIAGYLSYEIPRHRDLNNEIRYLKKRDKELEKDLEILKISHTQTERLLKHMMRERFNGDKEDHNSSCPTTPLAINETHKNINAIRQNLNGLVLVVANLTLTVSNSRNLSHTKILRLRTLLNRVKVDLKRLQRKVNHLNESIYKDTRKYLVSATQDLRHDINGLQNWTILTARNLSELWRRWNRTDTEVEDIIKLIRQHNETLHFKIAYHSDALSIKIKDVENKQSRFENRTLRDQLTLTQALNKSVSGLKRMIRKEIQQTNATFHNALENAVEVLRSLVRNVNLKIGRINRKLREDMASISNKQTEIETNFSKTKAKFQEKDRKHDSAISQSNQDVARLQNKMTILQSSLDSKTNEIVEINLQLASLKKTVNEMKNNAIPLANFKVYQALICACGTVFLYTLF
ncbi:dynein regulatory complex subunit 4-like [Xenia sp. Carnegie-2017]|uniref:dynein regulatory complex subunit 4-like n=1 Tax=Xenia sp. Carnegie-2017 TaxID=2897299 RepID=UPI001F0418AF|nr:dynein regulatory complex subunit 4-like [Xenia sp. Carnegie-2017]